MIGLTGAIGVGKSSVLAAFALRGYPVLSADAVVHDLYLGASVRDQLVAQFGADVLGADGEVDRPALARRWPGIACGRLALAPKATIEGKLVPSAPSMRISISSSAATADSVGPGLSRWMIRWKASC